MQQTVKKQNMKSRITDVVQERKVLVMLQKNLIYTQSCDLTIFDNKTLHEKRKHNSESK